jgi:sulfatase modifying factor 1
LIRTRILLFRSAYIAVGAISAMSVFANAGFPDSAKTTAPGVEQAQQASQPTHVVAQAKAAPRGAGAAFRDCRACPEMIVLPIGSFTMGSSAEEKSWAATHGSTMGSVADEAPQHQVSLPSFALGKYDVTRSEYAAFARETGYPAGDGCGSGRAIFKWQKDPKLTWENPGYAQSDRDPVAMTLAGTAGTRMGWAL